MVDVKCEVVAAFPRNVDLRISNLLPTCLMVGRSWGDSLVQSKPTCMKDTRHSCCSLLIFLNSRSSTTLASLSGRDDLTQLRRFKSPTNMESVGLFLAIISNNRMP